MKIVIVNQHTDNRGDEAAGKAIIDSLLEEYPEATIDVLYNMHIPGHPISPDTDRVKHYHNEMVYNDRFLNKGVISFKKLKFIFEKLSKADLVVNSPTGPNIGDIYKDRKYMLILTLAILLGKKTCIYACSLGPFKTPWLRIWSRFIFENLLFLCARDKVSFEHLKGLNLTNKNVYLSLDAVFQSKIKIEGENPLKVINLNENKKYIGVTAILYKTFWYKGNYNDQLKIIKNLADILNDLIENHNYGVVFFPHLNVKKEHLNQDNDDRNLLYAIKGRLNNTEDVHVLSTEYDSDFHEKLISKMDFIIGMRYHTAVFACKAGVPPLSIAYEYKAKAFMEMIGLGDLVVDLYDFLDDNAKVREKVKKILTNKEEYTNILNGKIPQLQSLAATGTKLIKELY